VAVTQASAQADYPNRPIRIITHSAAGGAPDVLLRIVANRMSGILGQQIVVMNQPGAGGAIAAQAIGNREKNSKVSRTGGSPLPS
jgi:tripartite-type tricarboxylate transporter receptor subunit TctC